MIVSGRETEPKFRIGLTTSRNNFHIYDPLPAGLDSAIVLFTSPRGDRVGASNGGDRGAGGDFWGDESAFFLFLKKTEFTVNLPQCNFLSFSSNR